MDQKAVGSSSSNRPSRHPHATAETLPLASPNWLPIEEACIRLRPLLGSFHFVNYDLTTAFAGLSDKPYVRTLRRPYRRPGRPRINNPRLWAVWFELYGGLVIYRRRFHFGIKTLNGYKNYAWLPDLADNWPSVFAPAPASPVKIVDKVKVIVERPRPRTELQLPSPLTDEQIQTLMGDVSELSDTEKRLRRYVVIKYGDRWKDVFPANAMKAAEHDPLYEKEVGVARWTISTWRRGLGHKK